MSKVKELVQIVEELSVELNELYDKLGIAKEAQFPLETVGAWATTVFINGNKADDARTKQTLETKTVEGTLEAKGMQDKNGKDLLHVKIDGKFYNTFNKDVFGGLRFNVGQRVKAKVQQNAKGFWNLMELTPVESNEPDDIDF